MKILVINPGSTSTKIAVYEDRNEVYKESISHSAETLRQFPSVNDQFSFRYDLVLEALKKSGYKLKDLSCIVARGGTPPGARSGATIIGEQLLEALRERPRQRHAANLGPMIAYQLARQAGIPSYIYDPISTDELNPYAKVFGVKGIEKTSMCHVLNTRAMAIAAAAERSENYREKNIIVVHVGGGCSVCLWANGRLTDTVPADGGTFCPERCGYIRGEQLVALCREYGFEQVDRWMVGGGGMVSLLGTNNLQEVEGRIEQGDEEALFYCEAMAYSIARDIASLGPVVNGNIDLLVFTGGGAHWKRLIDLTCDRIAYLNIPWICKPGEDEMRALAEGAVRVMTGEECAREYTEN